MTGFSPRRASLILRVLGASLVVGLVIGCSEATRREILSVLVDGVVLDAPPPKRRVRRDLLREIEDLEREIARLRAGINASQEDVAVEDLPPIEKARTWAEAAELLPKDDDDEIDWVAALQDGTIAPRPGVAPDAVAEEAYDGEVVRIPPDGDEDYKAVFRHKTHTELIACDSCHAELFAMEEGETPIDMERIDAGEACGLCHNTVAFGTFACDRCHPNLAED